MATAPPRPSREQLEQARGALLPDLARPGIRLLLCGINPSLWSAAVGHHFARPGNRFWQALHDAGFTREVLPPWRQDELLDAGIGITNLVSRPTARADELAPGELLEGRTVLEAKVRQLQPACVAFLGVTAYRAAFAERDAAVGLQARTIAGAATWVLPNPSGLNAHYQRADLARVFGELRAFVEGSPQ